jgi:hypothetical protein
VDCVLIARRLKARAQDVPVPEVFKHMLTVVEKIKELHFGHALLFI